MKSVFVTWKDINDGMWYPVAKLTRDHNGYRLSYTKGAEHANFIPFPRMSDMTKVYFSNDLFSFFQNRLLPKNRPEFRKMLNWSDMSIEEYDELDMLSISGGARKTDQFRITPLPDRTEDNKYVIKFFTNGVSHLPDHNLTRIALLETNEMLSFEYEDDNEFDSNAVLVTTVDDQKVKVGYCPKYLNSDIRELLGAPELTWHSLTVKKVNVDAPAQYRLLCEFTTKWPEGFVPCLSDEYQPYNKEPVY
ncbi:HIRAN domain-containing protein [Vibrio fluvialis]|uniref:HIRAN domain-containing protein n=1 Tax=Vibrio fluvialis TaxID=676 RepID=UPI001EEAB306|nr:HIRAN domain-containing protein [Vibrio fluvialis]MCG6350460.1 HIRAN domain-containing protein [Vibrio fluvialis]